MKTSRLILVLVLLTVARFWLAIQNEPSPSEAYFWLLGQRPAWGYLDGPPGGPLLARLFTDAFGDRFGLAAMGPIFGFIASLAFLSGARRFTGTAAAAYATVGLNLLPLFNEQTVRASAFAPAFAFSLLALAAFSRIISREGSPTVAWLLTGVAAGLATLVHLGAAAVLPMCLLGAIASNRSRRDFLSFGPYVALLVAGVCVLPALRWNEENDGIWFAATTIHSALSTPLHSLPVQLASAALGVSPLLFFGLAVSLIAGLIHFRNRHPRELLTLAVAPAALWLFSPPGSLGSGFAFLLATTPILLLAGYQAVQIRAEIWRVWIAMTLLLAAFFSTASVLSRRPSEAEAWTRTAQIVDELARSEPDLPGGGRFIIADSPVTAAALIFYGGWANRTPWPPVFVRESQAMESQFSLWPRYDDFVETGAPPADENFVEQTASNPFIGRSALYITTETPESLPSVILSGFESVTPWEGIDFRRGDSLRQKLQILRCDLYQSVPL